MATTLGLHARRWTIPAVLLAVLLAPAPIGAQGTAPPATARAPQATQAPSGPTLRLSMEDAVAMALETSLGVKSERLNLDAAAQGIAGARAAFLPTLSSTIFSQNTKSVPADFTQGTVDITSQSTQFSGAFAQVLPWYGSGYRVSWNGSRNSQLGGISTFNPQLGSSLSFSFSQPLLRNFRIDPSRAGLETAERQRVIADIDLQRQMVQTDALVRNAYLNLIAAIENRSVAQQNKELVEQSLRAAQARVAVGQSARIDIIQNQAQVANSEEQVILAESRISTTEDVLRALILDPARPDYWTVRLAPTDTIGEQPREIDLDAAIKNALGNRLDLQVQRRNMEITDLNLKVSANSVLPAVDVSLAYTSRGTAGTRFEYEGFPPVEVARSGRSFGGALNDVFTGAYPSWSATLNVTYPLGHTAAEASHARAQIQRNQQAIAIQQAEIEIVREVREAARQVETARQRVRATETALGFANQQLEAENRKFEVGLSSNLDLQVRQSQLASARVNQLNARIAYNAALIQFDVVQKIR